MKIHGSVRRIYNAQRDLNALLLVDVDRTLKALKAPQWHYESRLKEIESFSVKLETGRVQNPTKLEDFLACTLVVPNTSDIKNAYDRIGEKFDIKYRRPKTDGHTAKPANSFPFDDLRLYLTRKPDESLPTTSYDSVVFELQIKTFLQHAWGIATHDLNYKTDEISWSKDRVVAHLKAAIEHVELSLHEAKLLASSELVALTDVRTKRAMDIVVVLKAHWDRQDLPANIRGLADALEPILHGLAVSANDLNGLLVAEKAKSGGSLALNLSPYGIILQVLLANKASELDTLLSAPDTKMKILVTPEIAMPAGFPSENAQKRLITVV